MASKAGKPEKSKSKHFFQIGWLFILGLLLCVSVNGLDRQRTISQYYHTAWTVKDGSPSQIRALAQTNDGYLWLGTSTGLYRFDGVLFDKYVPPSGSSFPAENIYCLLATPDGGLWIGFWYGGISFLKDGKLINYGQTEGLPPGRIQSLTRDDDGIIWAATAGGLARLEDSRWQRIGTDWNYPGKAAQSVFVDKLGILWVATDETVVFLPKGARSFQLTGEHILQVLQFSQSPDGAIWMAETSRSVRPVQLPRIDPRSIGPEIRVGSVSSLFDRDGALWVTSLGDGLRRVPSADSFRGQIITRFSKDAEIFTEKDGLSADYETAIFEDREGNIWIGTANGLDRFRASNLVPIRFPAGYQDFGLAAGDEGEIWTGSSNQGANRIRGDIPSYVDPKFGISFIFRDEDGAIWMAGTVSIFRWRGSEYSRIKMPTGVKILFVSSMFKDDAGVLWVYLDQEGLFLFKNGVWARYARQSELPKASPITGSIDSLGRKWFGYARSVLTVIDGDNIRTFSAEDGLAVGDVKAIYDRSGRVWVAGTLGLAVFEAGRFRTIIAEGAESFRGISGMVETADGGLWLNEARGIVHIPAEQLRMALEKPDYAVHFRLFDFLDGLLGTAQQNRPFPTAIEGSDGRLWFSTDKGVVWIDPNKISSNPAPPQVVIRSLNTDEKSYQPSALLELPKETTRLRISFTALSLTIPERIRFRYKLEGIDKEWQDGGSRREADYTNLGSGNYVFRVIACNNDGVWNETGATLEFKIQPAFYQNFWFRFVCLLLGLFLLGGIIRLFYRWRLAKATARLKISFEERLAERNRIAQELHDTLLQGFLGVTMRLQAISNLLPAKSVKIKQNLDEVLNQVDGVLEEGRRAIWDIRSSTVTENDLTQAFMLVGEELNAAYPTNFNFTIEGESSELHPLVRDEIYRIGREAISNAFRHSRATKIEVEIDYTPEHFKFVASDNGSGIRPEILQQGREGHLGLSGMRQGAERIGAKLNIWSRGGGGTEVELIVPDHIAYKKKSPDGLLKKFNKLLIRKVLPSKSAKEPIE
jgi:signal transduction histidine kinase/ligand-binding sensor domain-containing protein